MKSLFCCCIAWSTLIATLSTFQNSIVSLEHNMTWFLQYFINKCIFRNFGFAVPYLWRRVQRISIFKFLNRKLTNRLSIFVRYFWNKIKWEHSNYWYNKRKHHECNHNLNLSTGIICFYKSIKLKWRCQKFGKLHRQQIFRNVQNSPTHISIITNNLRHIFIFLTNLMFEQVTAIMWRNLCVAIFVLGIDFSSSKKTMGQKTKEKIDQDWDLTTTLYGLL